MTIRRMNRVDWLILLLALSTAWMWLAPAAQAQIAFRGVSSGIGPAGGAITFRATTNAVSGSITFRAAASSGTPTILVPVFRGATFGSSPTGVLTLTVSRPGATLENDVMVASVAVSASAPTITAPPGWTLVRQLDNAGPTANSLAVYYKIATASEPANYTWTLSASTGSVGGIQSFGNVDITAPIDVENGQTTPVGTTHTAPSITTTVPLAMLVSSHTFASSRTWTPPGGMTESFDVRSIPFNSAAGQSMEGNRQVQIAAGATGTRTANAGGNADAGNAHILALRPALRIPVPAATSPNDVMIVAIGVQPNTAAITPPAGWTLVNRIDNAAATANSLAIYRKVAGAPEPTSYVWSVSGATWAVGGIQSFAGVDTAAPIDVQNGQATASALAHATPSVTTTVANTMVVTHHTFASSATWTAPAGMTESFDVASLPPNNAAGQSMEGARVLQAAAGATGTKTATASANADRGNTHILALRPSGTSIMINRPAGVIENDVLIAGIGVTPSSVTITPPAGWTLIRRTDNGGGVTNSLAVYMKVATTSEPTGYYWTFSAPVTAVGGIQAFAGVETANPIDIENGQTTPSATTHSTPNVTTTVANTMVVTHHTYSSSQNWTPPAGMTESFDRRSGGASPTGQSIEGNRVPQAAAGATGVKTATAAGGGGSADFGNTHILALRPEPGNVIIINTPPGTQANDVMVASIGFRPATLTITAPAGWTLVRRVDNAAGNANSLAVYRKVAGASEPATHTWTFSAVPTGAAGGIQSFSGVDTTSPIDVENGRTTPSSLSHPTPSVATTVTSTMIVTSHTFSSSSTWTSPAGMFESFDRASLAVPNAAGQSIEGNRVDQGPIGATGVKTATASGPGSQADTGNTHILALKPAPVVVTPGGFNAYEVGTAGITGVIKTKVAGTAFNLDIIALNPAKTAILTTFTGAVRVEVVDASSGGVPDANGCVDPGWPVVYTVSPNPTFVAGDNGRKTVAFTVPNSYPNARVRVVYPDTATYPAATAKGCSNDNFAIRPSSLANFRARHTDWQTAGDVTDINNVVFTAGGELHKAGRPFSVRADAVNGASAITTNYTGAPTATVTACAGAACTGTFGTLSLTTTFVAGQLSSDVATYGEVGSFRLQLIDDSFATVDNADGSTLAERRIESTAIDVGRFVPDHFAVLLSTPQFGTLCAGGSFTYVGQIFSYTAAVPVITVTAQDFANNTTTLYTGSWWRITDASLTGKAYAAGSGTLDTSGAPGTDPVIADTGSGTGTLTFSSGTGFFFTRTTPVAPFDAEIRLRINVIDADAVVYSANPAQFGDITAGNGIAFNNGKQMRFGRLRLGNANGSQLLALAIPIEVQHWNGTAFITNTADSCTTLAGTNVEMSNFQGNLGPIGACKTRVSDPITFASGRGNLQLSKPTGGATGSVDLTVHLEQTVSGSPQTCIGGAPVAVTGANRPYLQGNWTGGAYDQNPAARATFGVYRGSEEIIYMRENF